MKEPGCTVTRTARALERDLERWLLSASFHGRMSEHEHEVGDLHELVTALWQAMDHGQRERALYAYAAHDRTDWTKEG